MNILVYTHTNTDSQSYYTSASYEKYKSVNSKGFWKNNYRTQSVYFSFMSEQASFNFSYKSNAVHSDADFKIIFFNNES